MKRLFSPAISSSSMSLIVAAILATAILATTSVNGSLVEDTCTQIAKSDPNVKADFCIAAFNSDVASGKAKSLQELGLVSLRLGIKNATDLQPRIKELLQQGRFDQYEKECLKDCLEMYSGAKDSLKSAVTDFQARDFYKANLDVSAAMDSSTTCEDQFGEKSGKVSPLTKENGDFFELAAISLSISAMLR